MERKEAWDAYEEAVMSGVTDVEAPGDDYEMSERFKAWLVDKMRDEVLGQISEAGLDRMTMVKDQPNKRDKA